MKTTQQPEISNYQSPIRQETIDGSPAVSEETKRKLSADLLLNLDVTNQQLDLMREQIKWIDDASREWADGHQQVSAQAKQLKRICEYTMLIGLISNDLAVVFRVYLRAQDPYEVQYASKQIVVILTEGFKQLYSFVSKNEQGDLVTSKRNNSIWKKDIGGIVAERLPELLDEYKEITNDLELFDDAELKAMHRPRNIFVHYDSKPCLAYDELLAVHIGQVTDKAIPFLTILQRMMIFNSTMTLGYVQVIVKATKDAFVEHKAILENMLEDASGNPEAVKIAQEGLENLALLKADYDKKNK